MSTNALELLLNSSLEAIQKPKKTIEIPRLSKALGDKFEVEIQAIDLNQFKGCMKESKEFEDDVQLSGIEAATLAVREGLVAPNIKDKKLQGHMGATGWRSLLNALFLSGEIMMISEEIMKLSQLSGEDKKLIKKK